MKIKYKFSVGDDVWFVPDNANFIIKCNIIELDDSLGYWINEPLGRPVDECELFNKKEQAVQELFKKKKDDKAVNTLEEYREKRIKNIILSMKEKLEVKSIASWYPEKNRKEYWFHQSDLNLEKA